MTGRPVITLGWMFSALLILITLTACSSQPTTASAREDLAIFDVDAFDARLTNNERPAVVNVWGSWCLPCRSEAPLFVEAYALYGEDVEFLGIAINDTQNGATAFIEEFGIPYENLFDQDAEIRSQLGGIGAPITYFIAPGGEIIETHLGIIDGQQLAISIDELIAGS